MLLLLSVYLVVFCAYATSNVTTDSVPLDRSLDDATVLRRLTAFIKSADTNNDGLISKSELVVWLHNNFVQLDEQKGLLGLREADTNKDGVVSLAECLKYETDTEETGTYDKETEQHREYVKQRFAVADGDASGGLSAKEFAVYLAPQHYDKTRSLAAQFYQRIYDTNGDGFIDMKEFRAQNPNESLENAKKEFSNYDTNNDGFLGDEEAEKFIADVLPLQAHAETERLMLEVDDNRDGHLSSEEIAKHRDSWLGGAVTRYGADIYDAGRHDEL